MNRISDVIASIYAFITKPSDNNHSSKSESLTYEDCFNENSIKGYFFREQTEQLFQSPPIYSRIITHLNYKDLDALKNAISQEKSMWHLSNAIDRTRKGRLGLLSTPQEHTENTWKPHYLLFSDGRWGLKYEFKGGSVQRSYTNPPDISKVYSLESYSDYHGYGLNMYGVLATGEIFSFVFGQSIFQMGPFVGIMTIFPDWNILFMEMEPQELRYFIRNMRIEHSTALMHYLEKSEGSQTELQEDLIEALSSIPPSAN